MFEWILYIGLGVVIGIALSATVAALEAIVIKAINEHTTKELKKGKDNG